MKFEILIVALVSTFAGAACSSASDRSDTTTASRGTTEQGLLGGPTQYRTCSAGGFELNTWAAAPNDPYTPNGLIGIWGQSDGLRCFDVYFQAPGRAEQQITHQCLTPPSWHWIDWQEALGWLTTTNQDVAGGSFRFVVDGASSCVTPAFAAQDAVTFVKHGNNGTVDCNTYCAGPEWGATGACVGSAIASLSCNQRTGLLRSSQQTCTCSANGLSFVKGGDNGTADCDTFCAGPQWGAVGACVGSQLQTNASVVIGGANVAYDADCTVRPGLIGTEMSCICRE